MNVTHTTFAEYRDHMGSDLTVVNAARASFGKESDWEYDEVKIKPDPQDPEASVWCAPKRLKPDDANLIRFLATGYRTKEWDEFLNEVIEQARNGGKRGLTEMLHGYKRKPQHWAPFGHPHVQIRVSMPIFLARQFVKHQVGGVWSEESRRYVSDEPEVYIPEEPGVYIPEEWHTRPEDIKQGAGNVHENSEMWGQAACEQTKNAVALYNQAVGSGIAPEEARTILPLNMMTTVVWTGSLLFWSRVVNQRVDGHAQLAAQVLGKQISAIVGPLFPVSWRELTGRTE